MDFYLIGAIFSFLLALIFTPLNMPQNGSWIKSVTLVTILSWLGVVITIKIRIDRHHIEESIKENK